MLVQFVNMAESWRHVRLILSVLLSLFAVGSSDTCTTSKWYNSYTYQYEYDTTSCSHGCCGIFPSEYCCSYDNDTDSIWIIWTIVGSVLGGLFFISMLIVLICVALKKQGYSGRVIQPVTTVQPLAPPAVHTTVAFSGTSGQYPGRAEPGSSVTYQHPPPYSEPLKY